MSILCYFGLHEWRRCKCMNCGKTCDTDHDWSQGCKCSICGKTRDEEHDWSQDCKTCSICGKTRDVEHDWSQDCEYCSRCGKTGIKAHVWQGCQCRYCGKENPNGHLLTNDSKLAREAEAFADAHIELKLHGSLQTTSATQGDMRQLVELIDKVIAESPPSADLLYAKASAYYLGLLGKEGQEVRERVLALEANHLDARMKRDHFDSWQHVFHFPSWTENRTSLHTVMQGDLEQGRYVQVVRDGLKLGIAVVFPDKGFAHRIKRARWQLMWVKTPHGPVAMHYLVMDWGGGDTRREEACVPHAVSKDPTVQDGFWLLQRLARMDGCFLVLADGNRVTRNERFVFPPEMKRTLSEMGKDLDRIGPANSAAEVIRTAAQWHMDHFPLESINF